MKERDISDVEDCMYKIEALLKEYNCCLCLDEARGNSIIVFDKDTRKSEVIVSGKVWDAFRS